MLAWTIYLSFAGALLWRCLPKGRPALARWLALAVAVAGLALAVAGFVAGMGQGRSDLLSTCPGCRRWGFISCLPPTASAACWCCLRAWPRSPACSSVGISNCGQMSFSHFFWR